MLGPTPRTSNDNTFEPSDELLRRGLLHERGIQDLSALYIRANEEPAQVFLYGLDFRKLGHGLVIPIFHVFLRRFLGSEGRVAFFERQITVSPHRPNQEAGTFELRDQLRRIVQPDAMDLVDPPVIFPHLPETDDAPLHSVPPGILLPLREHRPIVPHTETLRPRTRLHLPRTEHVEDEYAARSQGVVDAPEHATESQILVLGVEGVVEDLAYGRDRLARRDPDLEKRPHPKLGLGRPLARYLDHRFGDVYAEDVVTGVDQVPRQEAGPATKVHDEALAYSTSLQYPLYPRCRVESEVGMPDVVDVGQVHPVPPAQASTTCEPDRGSVEHRDGLSVDSPVEAIEHDGAGVEGSRGALAYPLLALFVLRVRCNSVHHYAGVCHVHGDVAGEDLQRHVGKPGGLLEPVREPGVDWGHGPLASRSQCAEPDPEVRMPGERKVRRDVHLDLRHRPGLFPLGLTDFQSLQEPSVQSRMRLVRVQMTVLVEEYLGEGELQPLVVAALRDERRQVQPAHPDVPVVLDRERPDPLRIRIPLRKPFQKGMRERRMPNNFPLQAPQKLLSIHPALLPEDLHQFNASFWAVGESADQVARAVGSSSCASPSGRKGSILHLSRRAMALSKSSSSVRAYRPPVKSSPLLSVISGMTISLHPTPHPKVTEPQHSS